MLKLSLAEKILCLISYQLETKNKFISDQKLKELLGNPPKSTYYRILKLLIDGGLEFRPLLSHDEKTENERRYKFYFELKR